MKGTSPEKKSSKYTIGPLRYENVADGYRCVGGRGRTLILFVSGKHVRGVMYEKRIRCSRRRCQPRDPRRLVVVAHEYFVRPFADPVGHIGRPRDTCPDASPSLLLLLYVCRTLHSPARTGPHRVSSSLAHLVTGPAAAASSPTDDQSVSRDCNKKHHITHTHVQRTPCTAYAVAFRSVSSFPVGSIFSVSPRFSVAVFLLSPRRPPPVHTTRTASGRRRHRL